jgi:hypothetical protein
MVRVVPDQSIAPVKRKELEQAGMGQVGRGVGLDLFESCGGRLKATEQVTAKERALRRGFVPNAPGIATTQRFIRGQSQSHTGSDPRIGHQP